MLAHDWLDRLGSLVSMIEGDCANIVVEHVGLNDAVEKVRSNGPEVSVDGCSCTANEVPCFGFVVGESGIGVLKVCDGN